MSLRSILGRSNRVKKKPAKPRPSSATSNSNSRSSSSSAAALSSLPRTKTSSSTRPTSRSNKATPAASAEGDDNDDGDDDDEDDDILNEPLTDRGLVAALISDLTLRDVPQAMLFARSRMFAPLPARGLGSALTAAVHARRETLPPVLSAAHLHALLAGSTPTTIERETAMLVREGTLRRVVVPRRGCGGEMLVLAADVERLLLRESSSSCGGLLQLDEETREAFKRFLRENPTAIELPGSTGLLQPRQLDALVRAGFLTNSLHDQPDALAAALFARPEDRGTLVSLATVAKAASGSVEAVGGEGALRDAAGAARAGPSLPSSASSSARGAVFNIAVPGTGAFLKLVSAALDHLVKLLERLPHREAPEYLLSERWDGGAARGDEQSRGGRLLEAARLARGERVGTPPGRTRRWKDFSGLRFEWILAEAVGAGLVEVFETGSVGRGVRLVQ